MPRTATNPQTGETVQFDEQTGQWIPVQQTSQLQQAAPQTTSLAEDLQRQLGLTARAGLQGALALPNMLAEIPRQALNLIPGVDFPPQQQNLSQLLSDIGLPKPETPIERVAGAGAEALAGAGGVIGLGKSLASAAPAISSVLTTAPGMQALSAGSGGVAAQTAAEKGVGPAGQAGAAIVAGLAAPGFVAGTKALFRYQSPTKQRIAEMLQKGSTDVETAKFKLAKPRIETYIEKGAPRITKDKAAVETIKQGFDDGVVAAVKGASRQDKKAMLKMVNVMERGKNNARYAVDHRPTDVAGDSLMKRVRVVFDTNRKAGNELDRVAKGLKGKPVNTDDAVQKYIDDLGDMGISLEQGDDGVQLIFDGSDIEGLDGPIRVVKQAFKRLSSTNTSDAYDVHRMKRFIDEQVSYGKSAEGLSGKTEGIMKGLRRNLDAALDSSFPEYDRVNTRYADTRGALDSLQSVAGKKIDLTGKNAEKAVGTLLRRLMSNVQSRVNLVDAIDEVEGVATKYGGKFDDDLLTQVLFADELDSVFKPVARTSFQGQIGQAVDRAAKAAQGPKAVAIEAAGSLADRARGINEEQAFKAIKRLLRESR